MLFYIWALRIQICLFWNVFLWVFFQCLSNPFPFSLKHRSNRFAIRDGTIFDLQKWSKFHKGSIQIITISRIWFSLTLSSQHNWFARTLLVTNLIDIEDRICWVDLYLALNDDRFVINSITSATFTTTTKATATTTTTQVTRIFSPGVRRCFEFNFMFQIFCRVT